MAEHLFYGVLGYVGCICLYGLVGWIGLNLVELGELGQDSLNWIELDCIELG